jgi:hypothetical protein
MSKLKQNKFIDIARRFARKHLPAAAWNDSDIKALASLLRMTKIQAYAQGFNEGYPAGYHAARDCDTPAGRPAKVSE